jgi:hypothetical protein
MVCAKFGNATEFGKVWPLCGGKGDKYENGRVSVWTKFRGAVE